MSERALLDYARRTGQTAGPAFTASVFSRVNLERYAAAPSALGDVYVAWNVRGVSAVRMAADDALFEAWFAQRFGRRAVRALEYDDDAAYAAARATLQGDARTVPLDLTSCSPFEAKVLAAAANVERGHARSYGWLARELAAPAATRAVGRALGRNPVPLLIPCHRIIRADNVAGGYVFGSDAKRRLLAAEGLDLTAVEAVSRRGFRFIGGDDGTFCLPTCGDIAARIDAPGYVGLHSVEDARARGLEPCTGCRPIAA